VAKLNNTIFDFVTLGTVQREKIKLVGNSEGTIRTKDFNLIYVYPDQTSNDSWQKVQKFAESQKRANQMRGSRFYIIKSTEKVKTIASIYSQTIESSLEKLKVDEQKLTDESIKHIMQMKEKFAGDKMGIQFSALMDQTEINLLMTSSKSQTGLFTDSSDTLKKRLAEIVELETAILFCDFRFNDSSKQRNEKDLSFNDSADSNFETSVLSNSKLTSERVPNTIFPQQEKIGDGIFQMILSKLGFDSDLSLKTKFKDFKFLILLPKFVSLEKQTKARIKREESLNKDDAISIVRICTSSSEMKEKWKNFIVEAKTNEEVFYLIIHDECHWAAGHKQEAYNFLGFDKGDYHFHEENILPNLFTLMVSATPYNFLTIESIQEHILNWSYFLKENGVTNDYNGITSLRVEQKIKPGIIRNTSKNANWKEDMYAHFSSAILNGFSEEFICCLLDYHTALHTQSNQEGNQCKNPSNEIVTQSIEKCIKENRLIVVRLESAFDEIRQSEVAKQVIEEAIKKQNLQLEVIVDNSSKDFDVSSQLKNENFKMTVLQNVKHRTGNSSPSNIQIADLKGVPAIVFIIEKCRMGDTFPSSCVCFDLRSRYLQPVKDFTSIIQDVGRAFGYGERPFLLLSPEADDFLTKIWNNDSEGISWENLKDLVDVNLGKNMIRRTEPKMKQKIQPAAEYFQQKDLVQSYDFLDLLGDECDSHADWTMFESDDLETEKPEEIVRMLQEIYQTDPKNPVFLYNLKLTEETFKHRIILKAEPQIGKTGSFIHLIKKFCQLLRSNDIPTRNKVLPVSVLTEQNEGGLLHFTNSFYKKMSTEEIKKEFATETGRTKYRNYMKGVKYARKKRKTDGILEPSKWAALCLIDGLQKNFKHHDQIHIADFGCGDMKFTEHLLESINKNGNLLTKEFHIYAYDLSSDEIQVSEEIGYAPQISVHTFPGKSFYFFFLVSFLL
jgi:hypothetical protein